MVAALDLRLGDTKVDKADGSGDRSALTLLGAALEEEAGIEDGRLPGVYMDEAGGHAGCPWRSGIRREGFEYVKGARHVSHADAARRILEVYQAHPAYVEAGRFTLGAGKHVNAAQLARLVAAARADAGRCLAPGSLGSWTPACPPPSLHPRRRVQAARLRGLRVRSDCASVAVEPAWVQPVESAVEPAWVQPVDWSPQQMCMRPPPGWGTRSL